MKTGKCCCGNRIFFNNNECLACGVTLGRCMHCNQSCSFTVNAGKLKCDCCHQPVFACVNQAFDVCHSYQAEPEQICRLCRFTTITPSHGNLESVGRWAIAERAKRRLLLELEDLHLPPFVDDLQTSHPLTFQFKENTTDKDGKSVKVITGHQHGVITINLAEANSVHRESMRVKLGEPQRTMIGHMRHEYGHYLDWSWASRFAAADYHRLFGDPDSIDYGDAMKRHYDQGPPTDWADHHVSAYATMHPWEDFAETVNVYLDIMAIATTANSIGGRGLELSPNSDAGELVHRVLDIVVEVSEYNFDLGLLPLLPERLSPSVIEKLTYVHSLRSHPQQETIQEGSQQFAAG